jgi:hypothetical protein
MIIFVKDPWQSKLHRGRRCARRLVCYFFGVADVVAVAGTAENVDEEGRWKDGRE